MSIRAWFKRSVRDLMDLGFRRHVERAARTHFVEFGYKGIRKEFRGVQYVIELQHCEVSFWLYKADLGSAIRPVSTRPEVKYAHKQVEEVMLPLHGLMGSLSSTDITHEVDHQAQIIVSNYKNVLYGSE